MNRIEQLEKEIESTHNTLSALMQELSSEKRKDWRYSEDEIKFQGVHSRTLLEVCSEYNSWNETKENFQLGHSLGIFHFCADDGEVDMGIEDAKKLVKYLQEKIEFLEGE